MWLLALPCPSANIVVALGTWLLGRLLWSSPFSILLFTLDALQLSFMRRPILWQLIWGACWWVHVVEVVLH